VVSNPYVQGGALHMLDRHLDRFLRSMASARVAPPFDRATLRAIILRTAAASGGAVKR
jgi:4-amino-4-deoxychorismate lyase